MKKKNGSSIAHILSKFEKLAIAEMFIGVRRRRIMFA